MNEVAIAILDRWLRRFYKDQINPTKANKDDAMTLTKHHAQTGYAWTKTVAPPHSSGDVPGQTYVLRSNDLICGPPAPWWHWRRWWRR